MLSLSCISAGLVAGPARYATAPSRAFVRAAVAVENAAPAGFYWGYDSSDPAAELVEPEPTPLDRLSFGRFDASSDAISIDEVHTAQANWASAIKTISAVHAEKGDFVDMAATAAGELYGYGKTNVLFKPTKATEHPFRPTAEEAMSYFVGAEAMKNDAFKGEDAGFAINGGRGWKDVTFRNHQVSRRHAWDPAEAASGERGSRAGGARFGSFFARAPAPPCSAPAPPCSAPAQRGNPFPCARSSSWATRPSRWATTSSSTPPRATRCASSTPLATARCVVRVHRAPCQGSARLCKSPRRLRPPRHHPARHHSARRRPALRRPTHRHH